MNAKTTIVATAVAAAALLSGCSSTANQHVPHASTTGSPAAVATATAPTSAAPATTVSTDCADYTAQGDYTACDVRDAVKAAQTVIDVAASPNLVSDLKTQTPAEEVSYLRGLVTDDVLAALTAHPDYLGRLVVDPAATAGETFVKRGNPVISNTGTGLVKDSGLEVHFDAAIPVTVHTPTGRTLVWTFTKHVSVEMSNPALDTWTMTNLLAVTASHSQTAGE